MFNQRCRTKFQAKLTPRTAKLLQEIVPIADADIEMMKQFPMRSFDPKIIQVSIDSCFVIWKKFLNSSKNR